MTLLRTLRRSALAMPLLASLSPAVAEAPGDVARWPTWIIASPSELRLPAPPDEAATRGELEELRRLAARRDAAMLARIRHWDAGGPAYRWNEIAVAEAVRRGIPAPLFGRHLALMNAAIHDATVASYDSKAAHGRVRPSAVDATLTTALPSQATPSYPSEHAAAAAAAASVLAYIFPEKAAAYAAMAREAGESRIAAGLQYRSDVEAGMTLGEAVGARAVARGRADGSDARWTGTVPTGPGKWQGTAPALPQAGTWRTWALGRGDAIRPAAPAFDGPEIARDLAELRAMDPSRVQSAAAVYWEAAAGGLRSPAFWNEVTARKVLEHGLAANPAEAVRAFALVSIAFHDAAVACWDAKYAYWLIRPAQLDPSLKPLFAAPPHPSYPSAHACLSGGAGAMLVRLFPSDREQIEALMREAGESRLWARIHYRVDVEAGNEVGRRAAEKVATMGGLTMMQ
ncbi:phosphatase PAP2 family protein [Elioraea rosea]|uniref:phosphatase PAP2 family protein n=1 Tax=Elioraea rosea TaxID=2492390 RepID=UPI0013154ADB|nr:phosphatase PAP2 family protein [Elioraea rosea]